MEKLFVPYKLAVKLKELGFDGFEVFGYYNLIEYSEKWAVENRINPDSVDYLEAPLWQQAFDWFDKQYGMFASFDKVDNTIKFYYDFTIIDSVHREYNDENMVDSAKRIVYWSEHETYEEARQSCLEKLIEIVADENIKNQHSEQF